MSDHQIKILKLCEPRIVQDAATGLYYYLSDPSMGFYTSDDLRIIANKLDELNEGWYQVSDKHLEDKMKNKPNWKKGDIVALIDNAYGDVLSVFKALHDPVYCATYFSDKKDWYYGLRNCQEIRPATKDDIDNKIKFQTEKIKQEQLILDKLLNFREILEKSAKVLS